MRTQQTHISNNVFGIATLVADTLWARRGQQRTIAPGDASRQAESAPRDAWLARLDRWLWTHRQRRVDAQLARSSDVYELESRMRDLERGIPSRYY